MYPLSPFSIQRFLLLLLLLLLAPLSPLLAQTPLSSVPSANPTRDARVFGHTPAGVPKQFVIGNIIAGYNVKHYGATGNGSTDDTTAIAATFAAAPAGATIIFPAGTYLMTNYVTIGANDQTIIGYGAKLTSAATGQDRKFLVSGKSGIKFIGLKIDGGGLTVLTKATVDGVRYPHAQLPGAIHFLDSANCLLRDCDIRGINFPLTILGDCADITIVNNQFNTYYCAIQSGFTGYDATEKTPLRLTIHGNYFGAGLYPLFPIAPVGSPRDYTIVSALDTGAIRIRAHWVMSPANGRFFKKENHSIIGNTIYRAGEIGVELQAVNDSVVVGNSIHSCGLAGVSLSVAQRITVADNTISDCTYTGIEVDGYLETTAYPESQNITISNNTIDGNDEYGRQLHWIIVAGIIISGNARHVNVTGGSISYCRTGIMLRDATHVTIEGTRILTNEDGGYGGTVEPGGELSGDYNQGILVLRSSDIRLRGLTMNPIPDSWQRMINVIRAQRLTIEDCHITANMQPIGIDYSSDITIKNCVLRAGPDLAGDAKDFIAVASVTGNTSNVKISGVEFIGTLFSGINLSSPDHTVSNVVIENCDTRQANTTIPLDVGFVFFNPYPVGGSPGGTITGVELRGNIGPLAGTRKNTISAPVVPVTGTVTDDPLTEIYYFSYGGTLNLAATSRIDRTLTIYYMEGTGTVTIHPALNANITGITAATDVLTKTAHGLTAGSGVQFVSGTGFTGLSAGTRYYVVEVPDANTFKISATSAGTAISVGTSSSGVFAPVQKIDDSPADKTLTTPGSRLMLRWNGERWISLSS